jgi:ribosomal protein L37E
VVTVHCRECGDRYETDLSPRAVARIARCRRCGRQTLEIVPGRVAEPAPDEPER